MPAELVARRLQIGFTLMRATRRRAQRGLRTHLTTASREPTNRPREQSSPTSSRPLQKIRRERGMSREERSREILQLLHRPLPSEQHGLPVRAF